MDIPTNVKAAIQKFIAARHTHDLAVQSDATAQVAVNAANAAKVSTAGTLAKAKAEHDASVSDLTNAILTTPLP